ncbi:MAG: hypothetical protein A2289_24310 [Deltaproteobacteria bacterium RIFOXYA12_FULL_58_15]|nr:MAG: hypothetical protein A2289_24310 [Deltaproteobacteria bacterium RIFOXYA12_FULL_58_15]
MRKLRLQGPTARKTMASATRIRKVRTHMKKLKRGLDRKNQVARDGSTPTKEKFFGDKSSD